MYLPPEPYSFDIVIVILSFNVSFAFSLLLNVISLFLFLPKCFISATSNEADIKNANPSANGPAYKTPFIPNNLPKVNIAGIKNNICLDNDITALLKLFPIA